MIALQSLAALLVIAKASSAAGPSEDYVAPYRVLQQANRDLDPELAASAYATDGVLIFEVPGRPAESFRGRDAIRSAYVRTFALVEQGTPIDLEFRFDASGPGAHPHGGAYRARFKATSRDVTVHGRFSVKLVKQDGAWRFAEDRGTVATAGDFERLPPAPLDGKSSTQTVP